MFCENCGTKNSSSSKFCEKCGKELKNENNQKVDLKSFDYKGFYEKNKVACIIGAAVILVVILFLIFGGSSPEKVTDKFFSALKNGDTQKIVELLDFEKYEDKYDIDEDDIEDFAEELVEEIEDEDFEYKIISTTKTSSTKVKVKVKIINDDDETENLTIVLVKNGSKWKIDPLKTFGNL